jgi:hypothetical protein
VWSALLNRWWPAWIWYGPVPGTGDVVTCLADVPGGAGKTIPRFDDRQSQLVQMCCDGSDCFELGNVGEDLTPPQAQCCVEFGQRALGFAVPHVFQPGVSKPLELARVDRCAVGVEAVATAFADDDPARRASRSIGFESLAQMEHVGLNRGGVPGRRSPAPHRVCDARDADGSVVVDKEQPQNGPLLRAAEINGRPVQSYPNGSENFESQAALVPAGGVTGPDAGSGVWLLGHVPPGFCPCCAAPGYR